MSFTVHPLNGEDASILDKTFGLQGLFVEFNPGRCILPTFHARICQQILDAPIRKDDVWLISYPRTGSTWCQEMVWLLGNDLDYEKAQNVLQQFRAPLIEMSTALFEFHQALGSSLENSVEFVNSKQSPRFIKSHLPEGLLPTQLNEVKPKIIYTCRNPKDMCISLYYHYKLIHTMNATFEEFCDLLIRGLLPLGPVFAHYLAFWRKRHEPNVLFLRYEDMKRDSKNTVKEIAKFLGKEYTEQEYDALCDFLSFQKMRDNRGCNFEILVEGKNGKDYYKRVGGHFIRKGIVGDWKNHMSSQLAARFDQWIEENTKGTGLTFE